MAVTLNTHHLCAYVSSTVLSCHVLMFFWTF